MGVMRLAERRLAALVLAAGEGKRMGAAGAKLLLPWVDGRPLVRHTVLRALDLEPYETIVVLRPDLPELVSVLEDLPCKLVANKDFREGISTSISAGIRALSLETEAVLLLLGDQPDVPRSLVEKLLEAYDRDARDVTIARYGEQVGPPAIFNKAIFPNLLKLKGDSGARQLVSLIPDRVWFVQLSEGDRPGDIDTPSDYEKSTSGQKSSSDTRETACGPKVDNGTLK